MMTQKELIGQLKELKAKHNGRLGMLEHIVNGSVSKSDVACVEQGQCDLQRWLIDNRETLHKIYGSRAINEFNFWHEEWHNQSEELCELFGAQNKTIIGKVLWKNKIRLKGSDLESAKLHIEKLRELTNKIDNSFDQMLMRIDGLSQRAFQRTFNI